MSVPIDTPPRRRWRRRLLLFVLLPAVLFVSVPLILFARQRAIDAQRVRELQAKIRARGEPITAEELTAYHLEGLQGENAAAAWEPVFALKLKFDQLLDYDIADDRDHYRRPGEPWPARAEIEKFFAENPECLLAVDAALAAGDARFPMRFSDGSGMLLPQLDMLRSSARPLIAATVLAAHEVDTAECSRRIEQLRLLSQHCFNEPCLVSMLVGCAIDRTALALVRLTAEAQLLTGDQVRQLQVELRARDYDAVLQFALCGERAILWIEFQRVLAGINATGYELSTEDQLRTRIFADAETANGLECMTKYLDASRLSGPARIAGIKKVQQEFSAALHGRQSRMILSHLLLPACAAAADAIERMAVTRDATDCILALDLYRRQFDRFPAALADLIPDFLPAVPIDPFDGQPLRYRIEGDAAVLWSIGNYQQDYPGPLTSPDLVFPFRPLASPPETTTPQSRYTQHRPQAKQTLPAPAAPSRPSRNP